MKKKLEEGNFKTEFNYINYGLVIISIFLLFILFFGIFVKIDTYVIAEGFVSLNNSKAFISYKEWGILEKLLVKEGDEVKKGQLLAIIKNLKAQTDYLAYKKQYYYLLGIKNKLSSEINLRSKIILDKEFMKLKDNALKKKVLSFIEKSFKSDMNVLETQIKLLNKQIFQISKNIENKKKMLKEKLTLKKFYEKIIKNEQKLLNNKLGNIESLNNYKIQYLSLLAQIQDLQGQIDYDRNQVKQLKIEKKRVIETFINDKINKLQNILNQLTTIKEQMIYYRNEVLYTKIKAPINGQIINITVHHPGEVVKPGEPFIEISPNIGQYKFWVYILPKDRSKVYKGQKVNIHLIGFTGLKGISIEAKVSFITDDIINIPHSNKKYYKALLTLTPEGIRHLKKYKIKLVSGMPIMAYIIAEKVTPLEYMLQPIFQLIKNSFISP